MTDHVTQQATPGGEYRHHFTTWQHIYIFIGCLGFLGNAFVVLVILRTKSMRGMVTNTFITNQSIIDGLAGLVLVLGNVLYDDQQPDWSLWYKFLCSFWYSRGLLWGLFSCSSYNLVVINAERLVAVWKPLWHKTSFTHRKQAVIVVCVWCIAPIFSLVQVIVDSHVTDGICYHFGSGQRELSRALGFIAILSQYLLPAIYIISCNTAILIILHQRNKRMPIHSHNTAQQNVVKTVVIVSCCFVLCWITNETIYFMYLLGHPFPTQTSLYQLSIIAVFANCCSNPFIYIIKYRKFQAGVRDMLRCVWPHNVVAPAAPVTGDTPV